MLSPPNDSLNWIRTAESTVYRYDTYFPNIMEKIFSQCGEIIAYVAMHSYGHFAGCQGSCRILGNALDILVFRTCVLISIRNFLSSNFIAKSRVSSELVNIGG